MSKYFKPLFDKMVVLSTPDGWSAIYIDGELIDSSDNHGFCTLREMGIEFEMIEVDMARYDWYTGDPNPDFCGFEEFPKSLDGIDLMELRKKQ